jgi:hypothetical protein
MDRPDLANTWRLAGESWRLVGERWRLAGERERLVGERWRFAGERERLVGESWRQRVKTGERQVTVVSETGWVYWRLAGEGWTSRCEL